MMENENDLAFVDGIEAFKKQRDAVLLAHNYQPPEIQEIADLVGDSFALSKEAANLRQNVIVFCGVYFMAESAKILSPQKTVLLPAGDAGCPLADSITAEQLRRARAAHPDAAVVSYINTSAAVKAESDVCCTSSNAVRVVQSVPEKEILFVPDRNLASYVAEQVPEKRILAWGGECIVHSRTTAEQVRQVRSAHPDALLLVHPEVPAEVRQLADFTGSTAQLLDYVKESDRKDFIIGTEMGVLEEMRFRRPDAHFTMLAGNLLCVNMKKTSLKKVRDALLHMDNEVTVPEPVRKKAFLSLDRMLHV